MLVHLSVNNYALISSLDVEFHPGLSIITGETGAGKSILLGALGLISGSRADTTVLRNTEDKCVVEAQLQIKPYHLQAFFKDNDLDYDDLTIIRREILPGGKSRAFINDTPVNLTVLRDLASFLVDIHSQHETALLNSTEFQLQILDVFADNEDLLIDYQQKFKAFNTQKQLFQKLKDEAAKIQQEYDFFKYQLDELKLAQLKEGEQEELENELDILKNSEEITSALSFVINNISADESGIETVLKDSALQLDKIKPYYQPVQNLHERMQSAYLEIKDIVLELNGLAEKVEMDPQRLEFVEKRLDTIYTLQQKHKAQTVKDLMALRDSLSAKIQRLSDSEYELEEIQSIMDVLQNQVQYLAEELHKSRKEAIPGLENDVEVLLKLLGMPHASFKISLKKLDFPNSEGFDDVEFLFSANAGTALNPLSKVASGGEKSRFMLSLKAVISKKLNLPTIIFDEIDTGVSGDIADKVGNILKDMGHHLQVVNITHLPQVAAKGDYHYKVYKETEGEKTHTSIKLLSKDERRHEIAKMLSGSKISDVALQQADILLSE